MTALIGRTVESIGDWSVPSGRKTPPPYPGVRRGDDCAGVAAAGFGCVANTALRLFAFWTKCYKAPVNRAFQQKHKTFGLFQTPYLQHIQIDVFVPIGRQ
jgi:hypothetical protein